MNAIDHIGALFGSHGGNLLDRYRSCDRLSRSLEMLTSEIRELKSQRTDFHQEHGEQLETFSDKRDELTDQHQQVERSLADAENQKQVYEQSIETFWGRWIVWLKHLLIPDTLTVVGRQETIQRLTGFIAASTISSQNLANEIHQFTHQCQRLAIPLESFDFAIDYLQNQFASDSQQLQQQHQAIDLEIRALAKGSSPRLLRMKTASQPMLESLLDLKEALVGLDALKTAVAGGDSFEISSVDDDPVQRAAFSTIAEGIRSGFLEQCTGHRSKLFVEGHGTTHVRKTRSFTESYTDANGKPGRRTRDETYWDETSVDLAGSVEAKFDVTFASWNPSGFLNAIQHVSREQFQLGMSQVAKGSKRQRARLEQIAEQLTTSIRSEIESSLQTGSIP